MLQIQPLHPQQTSLHSAARTSQSLIELIRVWIFTPRHCLSMRPLRVVCLVAFPAAAALHHGCVLHPALASKQQIDMHPT